MVEALGEGVTGWSVGDRLIAMLGHGGLAEKVLVAAAQALPLPDGRSFEEGSALILTYATTIHALLDRGRLEAGETLLVLGAAGGVGLAAVELGKAYGARVSRRSRREEKAEAARAAGRRRGASSIRAGRSTRTARRRSPQQFKDAVGPNGADLIYDPVGGDYAEPALRAIAWEGRYLVVGFPAGIPRLPLNLTLLKSCDVRGVFWGAFAAPRSRRPTPRISQTLFRLWDEGKIAPRVSRDLAARAGRRGDRAHGRAQGGREAGRHDGLIRRFARNAGCGSLHRTRPPPIWTQDISKGSP